MTRTLSAGAAILALALAACEGGPTFENPLEQTSAVSECGGFPQTRDLADGDYCDAEVLSWQYEEASQTLWLADNRILLNCCGDHSMTISEEQGVYVATERDAPEFDDARCGCMCVFDYTLEANIPEGTIALRVVRDVTDWPEGSGTVFDDTIDLTQGSGSVILDDVPITDWCQQTM